MFPSPLIGQEFRILFIVTFSASLRLTCSCQQILTLLYLIMAKIALIEISGVFCDVRWCDALH